MNRRGFLGGLTLALAAPLSAEAQQAETVYRVGFMFTTSPVSEIAGPEPVHPLARGLVQGLRVLGYMVLHKLIDFFHDVKHEPRDVSLEARLIWT